MRAILFGTVYILLTQAVEIQTEMRDVVMVLIGALATATPSLSAR